jgi:Predicted transcriptional regulator
MQISRLFEIVYILLNKRTITAKELAKYFEVSTRTIYRDIDALCLAGIPIYASQGKGGGITLLDDYVLNKSILSENEQNEILIALQSLTATEYPNIDSIFTKLSSLFKKSNLNWIEVDFSPWGSSITEKGKFNTLRNAIINQNVVAFNYFNSSGEKSSRKVEPRKLVFKDKSWYLQGFCLSKKAYRMFKVNRIIDIQRTEEFYIQKSPYDMSNESKEKESVKLINLQLKISPNGAYRVYDEFHEKDVIRNQDGSFTVNTFLPEGDWLYNYILSFGTVIEVLEPKSIRKVIIDKLEMMIKNYK